MRHFLFVLLFIIIPVIGFSQFRNRAETKALSFPDKQKQFEEWRSGQNLKKVRGWKYYKRWEHETLMHVGANGVPPAPEEYMKELLRAEQEKKSAPAPASINNTWTSMGPSVLPPSLDPTSQHGLGRINCLAFHPADPNTYWVGVAQGGVWKTTDNGSTWNCLTDALPITRISDIAVDPNNTNTLYIALGDYEYLGFGELSYGRKRNTYYGMGIYKTTNGGATWQPTGLAFTLTNGETSLIRKIIVNPGNSNKVVAAGASGLYTSNNGGANWTQVLDSLCWDLQQDPVNPDILYLSTGYINNEQTGYAAILKSTNFGASWTMLNTGIPPVGQVERVKIAIAQSDPNYIYAVTTDLNSGLYAVYKSTNAGTNWNLQYNSLNILDWMDGTSIGGQGTYDLALMVDPTDKNIVYVGGVNMWGSIDGASSFDPISYWTGNYGPSIHADQHFLSYQPLTGKFFECNDGGIYNSAFLQPEPWSSATSGSPWPTVWTNVSSGMAISSFYRISSSKGTDGSIIAGAQDNATSYFDGSSWSSVIGGDGMDNWIDKYNPNIFIGSFQYAAFQKTIDGGQNFNNVFINSSDTGEWTTPLIGDYNHQGVLYVGLGNVYKSNNNGTSWTPISNFAPDAASGHLIEISALAVAPSDPNVLYVTKRVRYELNVRGVCYKTTNTGSNWTNITAGLQDSLYFTSIEISPDDANIAWVTCAGFSAGNKIFKTTDGGAHWQNISLNLPNLPVNVVKEVPGSHEHLILVGTDIGIYYTNDSIPSWLLYSAGLPNVIVSDLEINSATKKIYAATFGRGIWTTDVFDTIAGVYTDINQVSNENLFSAYPSPASPGQHLTVSFRAPVNGKVLLSVFDVNGKLTGQFEFKKANSFFEEKISLPSSPGIYFLKLECGEFRGEKKVVVR